MIDEYERAPYAPLSNVEQALDHYRSKAPKVLNKDLMSRIGFSQTYGDRVLFALRWLGLIDGEGKPTEAFAGLQRGSDKECQERLAEAIRVAYKKVFEAVDPATGSDDEIANAFRSYSPVAQSHLMVPLFMGLCKKAGIVPPGRVPNKRGLGGERKRRKDSAKSRSPESTPVGSQDRDSQRANPWDDQVILGLLKKLPTSCEWTADERGRWFQAFESSLDVVVRVTEERKALPPGANLTKAA